MIKWNKQFTYPESIRSLINNKRHYDVGTEKLPSVTTILQATQTDEKRASLERWKQRVGSDAAEQIKNTAANRGSIMHHILESYLLEQRHADLSDLGQQAGVMAQTIYEFKQSNTRKKKEWITDYFLQLAAYATAHNQVYGTSINSGVVLMCTKDNVFQKFDVSGTEFQKYMWDWLRRVDQYYNELGKNEAK